MVTGSANGMYNYGGKLNYFITTQEATYIMHKYTLHFSFNVWGIVVIDSIKLRFEK